MRLEALGGAHYPLGVADGLYLGKLGLVDEPLQSDNRITRS